MVAPAVVPRWERLRESLPQGAQLALVLAMPCRSRLLLQMQLPQLATRLSSLAPCIITTTIICIMAQVGTMPTGSLRRIT